MLAKLQSQSSFARGNSFRSLFPARPFFAPTTLARGLPSFHCRSKAVLLFAITVFFAATSRPADEPATLLKHDFDSAKSALDAGDLTEAERYYNRAIALGLRQVANISVSESRFDEATGEFDEALKFAPRDPEITVDAAIACFRSGDLKKARQLAQSVVGENPLHARAQDVLGRIELYRGDYPAAIRDLQASLKLNDNFETSYFLGLAYLKAKRLLDAQRWFQHLQGIMENSAALHVLIGRAYSITHFPEPAVTEFRKAIQLDPKYPHAHSLLGYSILEFRGEEAYPQARLEFEHELKLHPEDYNALLLLGLSAVSLRDFSAAEAALLHAARLRPKEFFPYLYLGETYSETKRLPQAVEALEKYLRLVPDPQEVPRDVGRAYYLLGQDLRRLGRLEEAQKALLSSQRYREEKFRYDARHIFDEPAAPSDGDSHTSAGIAGLLEAGASEQKKSTEALVQGGLQENPAAPRTPSPQMAGESKPAKEYNAFASDILATSYNDLGVMHAKASKFAEAAQLFKQAAAWKPTLSGLDRNWGLAAYRAELYAEAIAPLERQLTAHPDDAFVRQLLGLSYYVSENYPKVVDVLRPFLEHPPDDPGLVFALGTALVRTRQSEAAAGVFRRLLEQNAENPAVHLLLGQGYAQQEDYPSALAELKTALRLNPRLPDSHYYAGLVYLHQGELESAAQEFRAELQLQAAHPVTTYHLGYTLLAQSHPEEAVPLFRDVIKTLPSYESAHFELGRALLQLGDTAGAIESLETARKLVPDHDATYFQLSQAYRRAGRAQESQQALAAYQRLIETNRLKKRESMEIDKP